jgi:hypothetical protein
MWCSVISAGIPAEERHRSSHRGPQLPCEEPFLGWARNRSLGETGQASTMFIQMLGSGVGRRSTGKSRFELRGPRGHLREFLQFGVGPGPVQSAAWAVPASAGRDLGNAGRDATMGWHLRSNRLPAQS